MCTLINSKIIKVGTNINSRVELRGWCMILSLIDMTLRTGLWFYVSLITARHTTTHYYKQCNPHLFLCHSPVHRISTASLRAYTSASATSILHHTRFNVTHDSPFQFIKTIIMVNKVNNNANHILPCNHPPILQHGYFTFMWLSGVHFLAWNTGLTISSVQSPEFGCHMTVNLMKKEKEKKKMRIILGLINSNDIPVKSK